VLAHGGPSLGTISCSDFISVLGSNTIGSSVFQQADLNLQRVARFSNCDLLAILPRRVAVLLPKWATETSGGLPPRCGPLPQCSNRRQRDCHCDVEQPRTTDATTSSETRSRGDKKICEPAAV